MATTATWEHTRLEWARAYDSDLDRAWLRVRTELLATQVATSVLTGLTLAIIAAAATILASATGIFGYRLMYTQGRSMLPAITPDTLIVVQCDASAADVSVGDVIVFEDIDDYEGEDDVDLVSHRVTVTDGHDIVTQGDNNEHADSHVTTDENLVGIVRAQVPDMGWILRHNPWKLFWAGCVTLILGLMVIAVQTTRSPYWNKVWAYHDQLSRHRWTRTQLAHRVAIAQAGATRD